MNQRCILTPVKVKESVKNKLGNRQPRRCRRYRKWKHLILWPMHKGWIFMTLCDVSSINYHIRDRSNEHWPGLKRLCDTTCYLFKTPNFSYHFNSKNILKWSVPYSSVDVNGVYIKALPPFLQIFCNGWQGCHTVDMDWKLGQLFPVLHAISTSGITKKIYYLIVMVNVPGKFVWDLLHISNGTEHFLCG